MRYLSVCSGIEAATVAWRPLGWRALAFSEIEAFPCAVLTHHYPDVPNLGDMTRHAAWPALAPDVVVGGTPCQAFSVAGLRKGLADPRGNLTLTFLRASDIGCIYLPSGAARTRWGFSGLIPLLYYGADPYLADGRGSRPNSWTFVGPSEQNGHPCPKPLRVMSWIVGRASRESETIVDPFAGSGTTLKAAKDAGRRAIGIEIEERYCEIAAERCRQEVLNLGGVA
ncbi:MAG TPA: DNA methyltransferase [Longimicrobiaceae bacterium]